MGRRWRGVRRRRAGGSALADALSALPQLERLSARSAGVAAFVGMAERYVVVFSLPVTRIASLHFG